MWLLKVCLSITDSHTHEIIVYWSVFQACDWYLGYNCEKDSNDVCLGMNRMELMVTETSKF